MTVDSVEYNEDPASGHGHPSGGNHPEEPEPEVVVPGPGVDWSKVKCTSHLHNQWLAEARDGD